MECETLAFERDTAKRALIIVAIVLGLCVPVVAGERWSKEKANEWYQEQGWLVGCNFGPSTANNQLEMWQADTFDAETIDRELGWAAELGFNSIRVYLHDLVWKQDSKGFVKRIDAFLSIADNHGIGVMFVLLDGCWDPFPKTGKQREPRPHVHNSGWVQSPGAEILKDPSRHDEMEGYVKGVIGRFGKDKRVHAWDLFNEPDNPNVSAYGKVELKNKAEVSLMLLKKAFEWAREVGPAQPITAAPWRGDWSSDAKLGPMDRFLFEESDIITFHCYSNIDEMKKCVGWLKRFGRPILCTEYMTRVTGSTFGNILPYLKEQNVAAYNWGCVVGKTQTIYPWDSWRKQYTSEPPVWFHDIFHKDGTPYRAEEAAVIRRLTGKAKR